MKIKIIKKSKNRNIKVYTIQDSSLSNGMVYGVGGEYTVQCKKLMKKCFSYQGNDTSDLSPKELYNITKKNILGLVMNILSSKVFLNDVGSFNGKVKMIPNKKGILYEWRWWKKWAYTGGVEMLL